MKNSNALSTTNVTTALIADLLFLINWLLAKRIAPHFLCGVYKPGGTLKIRVQKICLHFVKNHIKNRTSETEYVTIYAVLLVSTVEKMEYG